MGAEGGRYSRFLSSSGAGPDAVRIHTLRKLGYVFLMQSRAVPLHAETLEEAEEEHEGAARLV